MRPRVKGGYTRRELCSRGASLLLGLGVSRSTTLWGQPGSIASSRPDVAAIDHDRILAAANLYLSVKPETLTTLPCLRSPGTVHDYYSEAAPDDGEVAASAEPLFTAHRDALFDLGLQVPALAAAGLLTGERKYIEQAMRLLRAWFVDPATSMSPRLDFGQVIVVDGKNHPTVHDNAAIGSNKSPIRPGGRFEGILETLPLIEVAQAIPFLAVSPVMTDADLAAIHVWFAAYLRWLTEPQDSGPRLAALARDRKDHHGSSWLLQAAAYTLLTASGNGVKGEDNAMAELRHRFRTVTLRAQISAGGTFEHELTTPNPYRNSLMNLDMLASICQLLTTRFENVWEYELQDGPGIRSAIAFHAPFIADRGKWPYRADAEHFNELPGRRVNLLFAARAYSRPEYATLWKSLPPDLADGELARTMPVHQPLLWVRQPPRRAE